MIEFHHLFEDEHDLYQSCRFDRVSTSEHCGPCRAQAQAELSKRCLDTYDGYGCSPVPVLMGRGISVNGNSSVRAGGGASTHGVDGGCPAFPIRGNASLPQLIAQGRQPPLPATTIKGICHRHPGENSAGREPVRRPEWKQHRFTHN